jgi:hypothetical protein
VVEGPRAVRVDVADVLEAQHDVPPSPRASPRSAPPGARAAWGRCRRAGTPPA